MFKQLYSKLRVVIIELQRVIDHSYRKIIGVPMKRYSSITANVFLGGQYSKKGLEILNEWGVSSIVNMRTNYILKENKYIQDNFKVLHLPTVDLTAPSLDDLETGIEFIERNIESGEKVYIHCKAGEGRGPTMTTAYLMSTGLTLEDALDLVKSTRVFIKITKPQMEQLVKLEKILLQ